MIGISGAQGTGKSTLARLLAKLLSAQGLNVATLSIDDFYYSKAKRTRLAREVHPLLISRGVPGTHDMALALKTVQALKAATSSSQLILPTFDKATDDCIDSEHCPCVSGCVDVIILEGWFVGAAPQTEKELAAPANELESNQDRSGHWRRYVNRQLAGDYQKLFAQLDTLIVLQAPAFAQVYEWRELQEDKLRNQRSNAAEGVMDKAGISYFIQHFERLTRHCLATLPARADIVFLLDENHRVTG